MKQRLLTALLGVLLALGAFGQAVAGQIEAVTFHSATLGRDWDYNIYLPTGYAPASGRYPVLYLLHGFGNDRDEWVQKGHIAELADSMIAAREIPPCLIVMPSAGQSWYIDRAEKMETAFMDDLLREVETHFAAERDREGRLIAGVSMGGYGALRFALIHPESFAAAALMSPAIYDPLPPENSGSRRSAAFATDGHFDPSLWAQYNYPALLPGYVASHRTVPLFVVAGSGDELHIGGHVTAMARLWEARHWPGIFRVLAGKHDFAMWRRVMPDAMRFLFRQITDPDTRMATGAGRLR